MFTYLDDHDLDALASILEDAHALHTYEGTILHGVVDLADGWKV